MIKYLLVSAALFVFISVFPSTSFADKMDATKIVDPETRAHIETQYMKKELALDSLTAASVQEINLKYAKANQELMTSDKKNTEKVKEIKKNSKEKDREMEKILTPDQYKKYTEKKKDIMEKVEEKVKEKK